MIKTKQFLLEIGLWHRVSKCLYVIIENDYDYLKEKKSFVIKSMGKYYKKVNNILII
jgi:hypothetical protein